MRRSSSRSISRRGFVSVLGLAGMGLLSGCDLGGRTPVDANSTVLGAVSPVEQMVSAVAAAGEGRVVSGGTLRCQSASLAAIVPHLCFDCWEERVVRCLFEPLTAFDFRQGILVGKAASSWEGSLDATRFVFHLREGAVFSNSEPVTAASFIRAWNLLCAPHGESKRLRSGAFHLSLVRGFDQVSAGVADATLDLESPDDYTLVVNLKKSLPNFPFVASLLQLSPLPAVALEDPEAFASSPVGNGPFCIEGPWEGGDVRLRGDTTYWGGSTNISGIQFVVSDSFEGCLDDVANGNLDLARIPVEACGRATRQFGIAPDGCTANPGEQCVLGESDSLAILAFNCQKAPFDDVYARRAVASALDLHALSESLGAEYHAPADNAVPSDTEGYLQGVWKTGADVVDDESASVLKSLAKDTPLEIVCSAFGMSALAGFLAAQLAEAGIPAEACELPGPEFRERLASGNFAAALIVRTPDFPTVDGALFSLLHSQGPDNVMGFSSPQVDESLDVACSIIDERSRIAAFRRLNAGVAQELPLVPLVACPRGQVTSDRVNALYVDPSGGIEFERCWLSA